MGAIPCQLPKSSISLKDVDLDCIRVGIFQEILPTCRLGVFQMYRRRKLHASLKDSLLPPKTTTQVCHIFFQMYRAGAGSAVRAA